MTSTIEIGHPSGTNRPEGFSAGKRYGLTLLILLAIVCVRFAYLRHWENTLDADEAVVGIMALHIVEQKALPIFYYGQAYMGTLEQFSMALFFKLAGFYPEAVRWVPVVYFLLSLFLFFCLIRRYVYPNRFNLTLSFLIFPSLYSTIWSMKARGGFIEVVFLFLLYLLLLFRSERVGKGRSGYVMAFLAGFSTYVNTLSLPFFLVAAVVSHLRTSERAGLQRTLFSKRALGLSLFFLLGLSPMFVYILVHGRAYGVSFGLDLLQSWVEKLDIVFLQVLPLLFGVYLRGLEGLDAIVFSEFLLFLLTAIAFVYSLLKYRHSFVSLLFLRRADYPKAFTFVSLLPLFLLLWFVSTYIHDIKNVRYFIPVVFLIPVYLTEFTLFLEQRSQALAGVFWLLVLLAGLGSSWQFLANDPKEARYTKTFQTLIDHGHNTQPLIDFLIENDLKVGYADYWIQLNIVYLSKEDLVYATYGRNRYAPYLEKVKEVEFPPHIDFRAEVADPDKKARTYSKMYRAPYQWRVVGDYIVFSCDDSTHSKRMEEKDAETRRKGSDSSKRQ